MLSVVGRFFSPQVSRSSSYIGRASYVVLPPGTDCDTPYFRLAPTSECERTKARSKRSQTVLQAVQSILTPCCTLFICVDSRGQGKTRRFASVIQRRAFTNWMNCSTWHIERDWLTSRGSHASMTAWCFHRLGL